jgi:hypothetical protein
LHFASTPDLLFEHAQRGGLSIDSVVQVTRRIQPSTAE